MSAEAPAVAVDALSRAVGQLEAAAASEDWNEVSTQLSRQRRFMAQWLPQCEQLSPEVRGALHDILSRYHAVLYALEAARERVRQLLLRPPPALSARERAYLEA